MELKQVSGATWDRVIGTWVKQLRSKAEDEGSVGSTYPYQIVNIELISPSRDHIEDFESRRNELDKRVPKLETIQGFYAPSTEDVLQRIFREGFAGAFAGDLTFCPDPVQAIQEGLSIKPVYKLLLCRVVLGQKGVDYTEIHGKYRVRNVHGVLPSFLITYKLPSPEPASAPTPDVIPHWPSSEPTKSPAISPAPAPRDYSLPPLTPEENPAVPGGRQCDNCQKWHQWTSKYCTRCGNRLDLLDRR